MTYLRNKLYALGQVQSTSLSHIYMIPGVGFVYQAEISFLDLLWSVGIILVFISNSSLRS